MNCVFALFCLLLGGKTELPAALVFLVADWLNRMCSEQPVFPPEQEAADAAFADVRTS